MYLLKRLFAIVISFTVISGCSKNTADAHRKYILIVAGQSQAVGRAFNTEFSTAIANYTFNRTKIWSVISDSTQNSWLNPGLPNYAKINGWEKLNINFNQTFNQDPGVHGIEPWFAYAFEQAHPLDTLYIIKYAYGGTPLFQDLQNIDWNSKSRNEMYDYFYKSYLKPAISSVSNYIPLGFWWAQGETDGKNTIFGNAYYTNLSDFFNQLEVQVPEMKPFPKYIALTTYFDPVALPEIQLVRNAEKQYCEIKSNNATLIDCDKAQTNSATDKHFGAKGYEYISAIIFPLMNK